MKTRTFNALLMDVVADKDGKFIKTTTGVDGKPWVSITAAFVEKPEAGKRPTSDEFQINFQKGGKKSFIYKELEKIAKTALDSAERDALIETFNSLDFEVNMARDKCPLYFVHTVKYGKAVKVKYSADHKVEEKRNQPQFGSTLVDYWVGDETAEERLDSKHNQIRNLGMFVTASSAADIIDDISNPAVKEMMDLAIAAHQRRVDAAKGGTSTPITEGKLESTEPVK